jgi:hypothetical protein
MGVGVEAEITNCDLAFSFIRGETFQAQEWPPDEEK